MMDTSPGILFRRDDRDRAPVRRVVTALLCGDPAPDRLEVSERRRALLREPHRGARHI